MPTPFHTSRFVEFSIPTWPGSCISRRSSGSWKRPSISCCEAWASAFIPEIDGDVVSFPRVAASCDFRSPARCEDVLEIDVTVERVGTKSVTYGFAFSQHGRDVAHGKMTSVCCRVPHGEPPVSIPIPDAIASEASRNGG